MIRYSHVADVPGMLIARGVAVTMTFPRHWHEEYQIVLVESGRGAAFYRGAWLDNPPKSLLIVHPGEVHENRTLTAAGTTHRTMNIPPHLVASREMPYFPERIFDSDLVARFAHLHRAWGGAASQSDGKDGRVSRLERDSRLAEFFADLRARYARVPAVAARRDRKAVRIARDFLSAHAADNPSLEDLAAHAGISRFHLLRVFRDATGMPPHAWLTRLRILRARDLLARGHAIASVAAQTGFADQSHLTRHFKNAVGVTPGEYRSKNVQDSFQQAS